MMPWYDLLAIMTAAITVLILVGVPVVFAFLATNLIVAFLLMGGKGGIILIIANATQSVTLFVLVTIPMFLLMGSA